MAQGFFLVLENQIRHPQMTQFTLTHSTYLKITAKTKKTFYLTIEKQTGYLQ